jgi:hypothetical protein
MMSNLLIAADQWDACAADNEAMAKWNRDHGFDLSPPGRSPGDYRAELYRRCARTLRLQHLTGVPHCMCHEKPTKDCQNT